MPLAVRELEIEGYRSVRKIRFDVGRLTVFVGANGAGKTNLYRALQLLQGAATGTLARDIAAEGGLGSAMWAGPQRRDEKRQIRLSAGLGEADGGPLSYAYEVVLGFPVRTIAAAFETEPQVKEESAALLHRGRRRVLLDRKGPRLSARDEAGQRVDVDTELMASETALSRLRDPGRFPDLDLIREVLGDWRFYHDLRTDQGSPMRRASLAVTSPTLDGDGGNLAAVFATLAHIRGDTTALDRAIEDAFPGSRLWLPEPGREASFGMAFREFPERVFEPGELSDGTLRFLGLAGALLAYRPPAFVALNEPEASLHPDLLGPLARMIVAASERTQVWLVTHSRTLAREIAAAGGPDPLEVVKREGATWIAGLRLIGGFADED